MAAKARGLLDRWFYFIMSLVTAGVVAYGFSRTVGEGLIHPAYPLPAILYAHVTVFVFWMILFIVQTALVRSRNVKLHRLLGWWTLAVGIALPIVGVWVGIVMARLETLHGDQGEDAFLVVPLFDMIAFAIVYGLAIHWRRRPEYHRRLMLIAACGLTGAGLGRFPHYIVPHGWFYWALDLLILLGVLRDLIVIKRIHPVYLYALPMLIVGQSITVFLRGSPIWLPVAHAIMGPGF